MLRNQKFGLKNHFFPKLLKLCKHLDFAVSKYSFILQINLNLNENLKIFFWQNSLNSIINTRPFSAKKRKNWGNPKGTKGNEQKFDTKILKLRLLTWIDVK